MVWRYSIFKENYVQSLLVRFTLYNVISEKVKMKTMMLLV